MTITTITAGAAGTVIGEDSPRAAAAKLNTNFALIQQAIEGVTLAAADGAITPTTATVIITKASAAALTLAAPSEQDGTRITIIGATDFAHVVTFTGGTLLDGTAGANTTVTFPANAGAAITVVAHGVNWLVLNNNLTTIAPA